MKKLAVLISGSGSNLEAIVNACNANHIHGKIVCVISNNPTAYGIERAKKFKIPIKIFDHRDYKNRHDFDDDLENFLEDLNLDLIVLAGFMRILGKKITIKFYGKMINLHPSLLPLYPGLNTHHQVLMNNDKYHGISIHFVSSDLDAGPLIAQGKILVKKDEDVEMLINRIHKIEHYLLPKVISNLCNENICLDCETNKVTYNQELDKEISSIYFDNF
tara:strand:+ start:479 stop:1132 length:654 start_codon:yes stop_codon:yes gene_type:complete